jgi:hypothetical protein
VSPQVDAILHQIESLSEADRIVLDQRLQELAEAEWKQEIEVARADANARGIGQKTIDDAIQELRYGS